MPFEEDPAPTLASQALKAWHATLVQAMHSDVRPDQGVFVEAMPPLAASARAQDFLAAGWAVDEVAGQIEAQDQNNWCGWASFSPQGQTHCALLFAGDITQWDGGAVLWVNGKPAPIPRATDGSSRLHSRGEWLDTRYFAVRWGGFHQHPRAAIRLTDHGLGDIYGMWIHDAQTHQTLSMVPHDDEAWRHPVAEMRNGQLAIYATPQDRREGRVARWVRL